MGGEAGGIIEGRRLFKIFPSKGGEYWREAIDRGTAIIRGNTVFIYLFIYFYYYFLLDIYGGHLLGVKSVSGLGFFDWESTDLVRRIEIQPKSVSG